MKVLLDMNVSPGLSERLRDAGHEALHWSVVGAPQADDEEIITYSRSRDLSL
jgi:predicted nuclease of predicted toxin-antitoxin system